MLKRSYFAAAGIVMATTWEGVARADIAPDPAPGADSGGGLVIAGVTMIAIVAIVAIMLLRKKR